MLLLLQAYDRFANTGVNSSASVMATGHALLQLIEDWDTLLGTNINFLFGVFQADAQAYATTADEVGVVCFRQVSFSGWCVLYRLCCVTCLLQVALFEFNARNQITLWGVSPVVAV